MEGYEYLVPNPGSDLMPTEETLVLFAFCAISVLFTTSMVCCLKPKKREEAPLLPVVDTMVHDRPSADNPFLKLRIHTFSSAEELHTPKPALNL